MSDSYRVRLDAFEGPMDLLLYLIRKHEVDLHDIPISLIADQYIGYLDDVDRIDIDLAGEFLVMASTLMELKSRLLASMADAKDAGDDDDDQTREPGADPRMELVRQLLEYKKYRDAADALDERRQTWAQRYPVKAAPIDDDSVRQAMDEMGELELEDLDLSDLVEAFRQIVASVDFNRIGEHEVMSDETPLEVHVEHIVEHLRSRIETGNGGSSSLHSLLVGKTRPEMVGIFLAILVLVRDQRVGVSMVGGEVEMELRSDVGQATETVIADEFDG
jgi:segregation and condensation protein A